MTRTPDELQRLLRYYIAVAATGNLEASLIVDRLAMLIRGNRWFQRFSGGGR